VCGEIDTPQVGVGGSLTTRTRLNT
jgi:hypothetical protein